MAEPFFDGNVLALVKNGIIQDFFADFNSLENDLVGSIFIGEVDRISKDLNSITCFNLISVKIVPRWFSKSSKVGISPFKKFKLPFKKSLKVWPFGEKYFPFF